MKTIRNEKLIKRNSSIGNWTSLAALVVLGGAMYFTLTQQELLTQTNLFTYMLIAIVIGFTLTQISISMGNKFGRSPRPDEKLDMGLKGLPNDFTIYHYTTPISHLLIGPAGTWVILPYDQGGEVTFTKKRWRNRGGSFLQRYLRVFGQGSLGRPDLEVEGDVQTLKKYLSKKMDESEIPEINALMVFTADNVQLDVEGAPIPTMLLKQIKDFIRQRAKEKKVSAETVNRLKAVLEKEG
ncbi:MAG TPA: hypothetical protein VKP08_12515 [Anaerolineales bacterium]|nr:hypothetical protein [Anaerolineales bacterium]